MAGTKKPLLAGTFALIVAAAVAGCGGGDSSTSSIDTVSTGSSTTAALSKDAFIKQADAICAEASSAVKALPVASAGAAGNVTVSQELAIVKGQLQSLKSLGSPDSGGPQLNRYLAALQDQVTALQQESQALRSGGDSTTAAAAVDSATTNAQNAARAFGMQACAGSSTPSGTTPAGSGNGTAGTGGTGGTVTPAPTTPVTPVTPVTPTPAPAPTPTPAPPAGAGGGTGAPPAGGGTGGGTTGGGSGGVGAG